MHAPEKFRGQWGIADSRKYAPEKIRGRNLRFSYAPEKYIFFAKFGPSSAMPPKDLAPYGKIFKILFRKFT